MPNTNKSHSELNTSLYFRDDRHRCQPVLCCLRADRFGESYATHIDRVGYCSILQAPRLLRRSQYYGNWLSDQNNFHL